MPAIHLRLRSIIVVGMVLFVCLPWQRTANAQSVSHGDPRVPSLEAVEISSVYFSKTGHNLTNSHGFLDYWRSQGQMLLFGLPLSEEFEQDGRTMQYFEQARFEFDSQSGQVQLGMIGREALGKRTFAPAEPIKVGRYFAETNHNVWGKFLKFWEKRGGLARFGLPVSEEFTEDGRIIQYFERARFEYHPEDMPAFYRQQERRHGFLLATLDEVQLTDLGRLRIDADRIDSTPTQALAGAPEWSPNLWPRRIEVDLSTQQLYAYEGELMVYGAPVATGRDDFKTPAGSYKVYRKTQIHTMRGSMKGETWKVPKVPWIMYFNSAVAIHGTYWHNKFGTGYRLSHGCVNVGMDDAEWLYRWAAVGTRVVVHQ